MASESTTCFAARSVANVQVRDHQVFASFGSQHKNRSLTSDHGGDMTVSMAVQADGRISEVKNMDGEQELLETAKLSKIVQNR